MSFDRGIFCLRPGRQEGHEDHGLVDENRQRKPSYDVWEKISSPASLELAWKGGPSYVPSGFSVSITPNTLEQLPSYPLLDYHLVWDVHDENGSFAVSGERSLRELSSLS
jgi:beta-glucuronidase